MNIKYFLTKLVARITGRKCLRCQYNRSGYCTHPNGEMFARCWQSITRPGFRKEPIKLGKVVVKECDDNGIAFTVDTSDLTEEEWHQMEKIVASLQEASQTARDGGLLETEE